jgi:hypothetical protein
MTQEQASGVSGADHLGFLELLGLSKGSAFSRDTDLTGLWSGEYWYGQSQGQPTPFTAHFIDNAGDLSGTTLEPATFGLSAGDLSAVIEGARGELSVRFTKLYDPAPGVHADPIFYAGTVDAQFTIIEGTWDFGSRMNFSGRFVLVRVSRGAQAEQREVAEELRIER